jgi:hypothetical protein
MIRIQTSYIEHDMAEEMQYQMNAVKGISSVGVEFADLDNELFGLFYSSNADVLVTFEFDESLVKEAFHILGHCDLCRSGLWNYDAAKVAECTVTQETIDAWVTQGMPWSEFKKTAGYEKLTAMSEEEQWDFSDENHFTALV